MEKIMMTVPDVQRALGVGKNTAYALVNREDFPKIRLGRKILIPRDALARWIEAQTERTAG